MILIVGGVAQGKSAFAKKNFPEGYTIFNLDQLVKEWLKEKINPLENTQQLLKENHENLIITINEIGCGIAPLGQEMREFRDEVGKIGCFLAEEATQVYRITVGVANQIK